MLHILHKMNNSEICYYGRLQVHMSTLSYFLLWYQMSIAHCLTPTVLSMWRLPGIHGGKSRDSSNQSTG